MSKQATFKHAPSMGETLCGRDETKAILSISDSTYWRLIRSGTLDVVRLGRCTRVKRSSIEALMNKPAAA